MSAPFRRSIFLLFDGARWDVMQQMVDEGQLPNIRRHLCPTGRVPQAVSAFPTVSGPAHLPFMTGCFPGTAGIPGIYWFDRRAFGASTTGLGGYRTYLGLFKVEKMNGDVTPGIPTLADVWPDTAFVFGWFTRGSPYKALLTRWAKVPSFVRGYLTKDWLRCDDDAESAMVRAVESGASNIFVVVPSPDEQGHRFGPTSREARRSYLKFDGTIGRLFDRLARRGEAESTLVMVCSDHGQSDTHTHFALDAAVERRFGRTLVYKRLATPIRDVRAVVLPSGNGMANVHFRGESWAAPRPDLAGQPYQDLIAELLGEPAVDVLAWRRTDGAIEVRGRRGAALLRRTGPAGLDYQVLDGDPFGYEALPRFMTFEECLAATFATPYPDAPVGLLTDMEHPRSGDLIVTALPGFDLRNWWEYQEPHGTHGGLHQDHARVPLLTNGPLGDAPMRTVDVYPTMAAWCGRTVPAGVEGVAR